MRAVFFGSIGTLAETSELQRYAFNKAFVVHGLPWIWGRGTYRQMLGESGGQRRIERYAEKRGVRVDAAAIHATKSEFFQKELAARPLPPRIGVVPTINRITDSGLAIALVTTTSPNNVAQILDALQGSVTSTTFDHIITADDVARGKPDPECYGVAAKRLGVEPADCLIIEDNPDGVLAASRFGATVLAFPGANTTDPNSVPSPSASPGR